MKYRQSPPVALVFFSACVAEEDEQD